MKVYFDKDGRLCHHECGGCVDAGVASRRHQCPVHEGSDWFFPGFGADVDVDLVDDWRLIYLQCDRCGKIVTGLSMWDTTQLIETKPKWVAFKDLESGATFKQTTGDTEFTKEVEAVGSGCSICGTPRPEAWNAHNGMNYVHFCPDEKVKVNE